MVLSLRLLFRVVSHFTVLPYNPWFLCQYPCFIRWNTVLPCFLRAVPHAVHKWGGGSGGPWVAWRRPWPRTFFKSGGCFNLPTQSPILYPSLSLFPTGDWLADLHGSFVSRTWQRRLRFDCLPTPVLATWVWPFSMSWLDSIARVRQGLPSLSFRLLREQTAKNISDGRDSAYRDYPFW